MSDELERLPSRCCLGESAYRKELFDVAHQLPRLEVHPLKVQDELNFVLLGHGNRCGHGPWMRPIAAAC